jgi:uncharacterized protein with von Willebrand factor type A (vWA) domain
MATTDLSTPASPSGVRLRPFGIGLGGSTLPLLLAFSVAALRPHDADLALLIGGLVAMVADAGLFVAAFAGLFRRSPDGAGLMTGLLLGVLLGAGGCALMVGATR